MNEYKSYLFMMAERQYRISENQIEIDNINKYLKETNELVQKVDEIEKQINEKKLKINADQEKHNHSSNIIKDLFLSIDNINSEICQLRNLQILISIIEQYIEKEIDINYLEKLKKIKQEYIELQKSTKENNNENIFKKIKTKFIKKDSQKSKSNLKLNQVKNLFYFIKDISEYFEDNGKLEIFLEIINKKLNINKKKTSKIIILKHFYNKRQDLLSEENELSKIDLITLFLEKYKDIFIQCIEGKEKEEIIQSLKAYKENNICQQDELVNKLEKTTNSINEIVKFENQYDSFEEKTKEELTNLIKSREDLKHQLIALYPNVKLNISKKNILEKENNDYQEQINGIKKIYLEKETNTDNNKQYLNKRKYVA